MNPDLHKEVVLQKIIFDNFEKNNQCFRLNNQKNRGKLNEKGFSRDLFAHAGH